jgi:hypothetical protein
MIKSILGISLVMILGITCAAQKQKEPPASDNAANSGSKANQNVRLESGTRINGELQNAVDVKNARVGDEVVLKTTQSIKQNGEIVIPKGTRLLGRVIDVQQRSSSNGASRLGLVFDRVQGKSLDTPINASIVSITNATSSTNAGDIADADLVGSSSTSAAASSGRSGGSSGGGLLGGVTSTAGGVLGTTTQTAGGLTNAAGQVVASTAGSGVRTVNGIQISDAVNGSAGAGTTLSSADRNIKLEKGVMIGLQLNSSLRAQ